MGHRFSKTAANNIAAKTTLQTGKLFNTTSTSISTCVIPIPKSDQNNFFASSINLQTPENLPNSSASSIKNNCITTAGILKQHQKQHQYNTNKSNSSLNSLSSLSCGRPIIIQINLTKMENGYETSTPLLQYPLCDNSLDTLSDDCNLNSTKLTTPANQQFLNLTLNSGNNSNAIPKSNSIAITTTTTLPTTSSPVSLLQAAGSSLNKNNNNFNSIDFGNKSFMSTSKMNAWPERFNFLQFNDEIAEKNTDEFVEYCEVVEDRHQLHQTNNTGCSTMRMLSIHEEPNNETNVCCRRKSKSMAANSGSSVSFSNNMGAKTKSRCRKCSCRDAFKRFLDPSLPRSSNKANKQQKEQKHTKLQDRAGINNCISNSTSKQQQHGHLLNSTNVNSNTKNPISNKESLWDSAAAVKSSDVVIPLTTPTSSQFVVVQCAIVNPSNAGIHSLANVNTNSSLSTSSLISLEAQNLSPSPTTSSSTGDSTSKVPLNNIRADTSGNSSTGPIVHSQIDFVHYLVPDLENVISSSFYWGKIDRYEAERLLEGKPEGTFLLRDSAQEEFLFSVTFRKYGRSLHARIEQSNHRFSFDCHDPCVFTASTVTGLLEHYKDPACVMFFEPMLTIPLHRKNCFSLQKLCRAAIVSNTTYDGINELDLPSRMKSYLKEYHYKQKLRTKSNELTYGLHCK